MRAAVIVVVLAGCAGPLPAEREQRVIDALADDNYVWARRDPALVALKLKKLQRGPYEWLRGTASLYWRDLTELGARDTSVGTAIAGWAEVAPVDRVSIAARGATLGIMGGRSSTFGGAIAVAPWAIERGDLRVWFAVDRQTSSGAASPVPGTAAADATVFMLIASAEAPFTP